MAFSDRKIAANLSLPMKAIFPFLIKEISCRDLNVSLLDAKILNELISRRQVVSVRFSFAESPWFESC